MREIKFRAWDKNKQKMIVVRKIGLFKESGWSVCATCGLSVGLAETDFNLMQYTGLKDKNGVEIYEGDIVEQEAIMNYPGEYGGEIDRLYIGQVVIVPSTGVCLKNPKVIERNEDDNTWICKYYKKVASYRSEIIGNIYENPDLL